MQAVPIPVEVLRSGRVDTIVDDPIIVITSAATYRILPAIRIFVKVQVHNPVRPSILFEVSFVIRSAPLVDPLTVQTTTTSIGVGLSAHPQVWQILLGCFHQKKERGREHQQEQGWQTQQRRSTHGAAAAMVSYRHRAATAGSGGHPGEGSGVCRGAHCDGFISII